jgi:hypothetical protein
MVDGHLANVEFDTIPEVTASGRPAGAAQ